MFPSMDTPWTFCRRNQQNFRAQQLQRREVSLPPNSPLSKRRLSRRQSPLSPWGLSPPQLPPAPRALLLLPSPSPRLQLYPLLTLKSLSWANLWSPPRSGRRWSTQVTQAALHSRKEGEEERRAATKAGPAKPRTAEAETSIEDLWLGCSIQRFSIRHVLQHDCSASTPRGPPVAASRQITNHMSSQTSLGTLQRHLSSPNHVTKNKISH